MNYLDYINCLEVCEEAGLEVYSNADICREDSHEEGPEIRQTISQMWQKGGKIIEILDDVYRYSLVLIFYMEPN